MLSRDEVTQFEQYEREQEFEEKEEEYGGRLREHITKLEKILAFWMGEDIDRQHKLVKEYHRLLNIEPKKRNAKQRYRIANLANIISNTIDGSHICFGAELDKHK